MKLGQKHSIIFYMLYLDYSVIILNNSPCFNLSGKLTIFCILALLT